MTGISQIYLCILKNTGRARRASAISAVNATTIAGIFCAGGDSEFGFLCDTVTMWCMTVPLGMLAAFVWKLPVLAVYFIVNLDEIVKLPAVYRHYKKYKWVRNLTAKETVL